MVSSPLTLCELPEMTPNMAPVATTETQTSNASATNLQALTTALAASLFLLGLFNTLLMMRIMQRLNAITHKPTTARDATIRTDEDESVQRVPSFVPHIEYVDSAKYDALEDEVILCNAADDFAVMDSNVDDKIHNPSPHLNIEPNSENRCASPTPSSFEITVTPPTPTAMDSPRPSAFELTATTPLGSGESLPEWPCESLLTPPTPMEPRMEGCFSDSETALVELLDTSSSLNDRLAKLSWALDNFYQTGEEYMTQEDFDRFDAILAGISPAESSDEDTTPEEMDRDLDLESFSEYMDYCSDDEPQEDRLPWALEDEAEDSFFSWSSIQSMIAETPSETDCEMTAEKSEMFCSDDNDVPADLDPVCSDPFFASLYQEDECPFPLEEEEYYHEEYYQEDECFFTFEEEEYGPCRRADKQDLSTLPARNQRKIQEKHEAKVKHDVALTQSIIAALPFSDLDDLALIAEYAKPACDRIEPDPAACTEEVAYEGPNANLEAVCESLFRDAMKTSQEPTFTDKEETNEHFDTNGDLLTPDGPAGFSECFQDMCDCYDAVHQYFFDREPVESPISYFFNTKDAWSRSPSPYSSDEEDEEDEEMRQYERDAQVIFDQMCDSDDAEKVIDLAAKLAYESARLRDELKNPNFAECWLDTCLEEIEELRNSTKRNSESSSRQAATPNTARESSDLSDESTLCESSYSSDEYRHSSGEPDFNAPTSEWFAWARRQPGMNWETVIRGLKDRASDAGIPCVSRNNSISQSEFSISDYCYESEYDADSEDEESDSIPQVEYLDSNFRFDVSEYTNDPPNSPVDILCPRDSSSSSASATASNSKKKDTQQQHGFNVHDLDKHFLDHIRRHDTLCGNSLATIATAGSNNDNNTNNTNTNNNNKKRAAAIIPPDELSTPDNPNTQHHHRDKRIRMRTTSTSTPAYPFQPTLPPPSLPNILSRRNAQRKKKKKKQRADSSNPSPQPLLTHRPCSKRPAAVDSSLQLDIEQPSAKRVRIEEEQAQQQEEVNMDVIVCSRRGIVCEPVLGVREWCEGCWNARFGFGFGCGVER